MSLDLDIIVVWNEITDTEVNSQYMYRTLFRIIEKGVITIIKVRIYSTYTMYPAGNDSIAIIFQ